MIRSIRRLGALVLATVVGFSGAAMAETVFEGKVTATEAVVVAAPYGGTVMEYDVKAGERIDAGDAIATIGTTNVYATADGTASAVFGQLGDSTEDIAARYGAVIYIEPTNKYTISASTEKAYNSSATKYVHVGETVYLCCTSDGTHKGTGVVTLVDKENYTVEVTGGDFYMDEYVNVFRQSNYATNSKLGRGTVGATASIKIAGSGSILKMHVKAGDVVERGQLLFETVTGDLDGLFVTDSEVLSEASGIVATADVKNGASVSKGDTLATIYATDALQIEVSISEYDLNYVSEGMKVKIMFNWNENAEASVEGVVTGISYLNTAAEGDPAYTMYIGFSADETVRLGMTCAVYAADETDITAAPVAEDAVKAE